MLRERGPVADSATSGEWSGVFVSTLINYWL